MVNPLAVYEFHNISSKDFEHPYHGQPIFVAAGERKMLPGDVADHLATHLARKIMLDKADATRLAKDEPMWSEAAIDALKLQILKEKFVQESPATLSPQEKVKREIEALNKSEPEALSPSEVDNPEAYQDRAQVIAELEKLGVPVDNRRTKAYLIKELENARKNMAPRVPEPVVGSMV